MTTIKLDSDGDLELDNGLVLIEDDLVAETAQRLAIKFKFFLGEWALIPAAGMPLFEKVLVKNPKISEIRRLYREVILGDPAVASINSLTFDFDATTRALSLTFEAGLNDGSSLVFNDFVLGENLG